MGNMTTKTEHERAREEFKTALAKEQEARENKLIQSIQYEISHYRENFSTSRAGAGIESDPKWVTIAEDVLTIVNRQAAEITDKQESINMYEKTENKHARENRGFAGGTRKPGRRD